MMTPKAKVSPAAMEVFARLGMTTVESWEVGEVEDIEGIERVEEEPERIPARGAPTGRAAGAAGGRTDETADQEGDVVNTQNQEKNDKILGGVVVAGVAANAIAWGAWALLKGILWGNDKLTEFGDNLDRATQGKPPRRKGRR